MLDLKDIRSLSDFQRNTKAHLARLKKSGKPAVLTVNGKAELVVQEAGAYQKLLEAADLAESVKVLQRRLQSDRSKDVPVAVALKQIRDAMELGDS